MSTVDNFKNNKYVAAQSVIPTDLCRIATKYALIKEETEFTPENDEFAQVRGAHSVYSDTLMETLMYFMKPHIEKITGLQLETTYTYYRVYRPGSVLGRHKDRASCEISSTVCLGFNYNNEDPNYSWGMYVDKDSVNSPVGPNGEFISSNNPGLMVAQKPGDIIVYRGCEVEHWRDPLIGFPGTYQVQAFFHYIDKNGPYYPSYAFDSRPGLGYKSDNRAINN